MAKRYLIFAAGAIALTACTSEEVVDDVAMSRNQIQFENVVNKLTRGDDLTSNGLKRFDVFGYYTMPPVSNEGDGEGVQSSTSTIAHDVFYDVTVSRGDDNIWGYDPKYARSWIPGAKYYFYAYSCGDVAKIDQDTYGTTFTLDMRDGLTPADRVLKINNYVCDNTHQHDLIYAYNVGTPTDDDKFPGIEGKDSGNDAVSFEFKHILSKIKARFTTSFPAEYEVRIKNVSVVNIRNKGSYHPITGWQEVSRPEGETPKVYLLDTSKSDITPLSVWSKADENGLRKTSVETNHAYVLPYGYNGSEGTQSEPSSSTYVYLNFEIEVYYNTNKVVSKILSGKFNPTWQEGYSYVYNVDIKPSTSLQDIKFTTSTDVLKDWSSEEGTIAIDESK